MQFDYTQLDLEKSIDAIGIKDGDNLFIHTALKSLGSFKAGASGNLLQSLLSHLSNKVGANGSISVPTFNFGFCRGEIFDVDQTPSVQMGAFSEFVRNHPDSKRSKHPFHSISSIGNDVDVISETEGFSEFSDGSAFDLLLKKNVKILFFGIEFVETFVHIAEERAQVPYRFWKQFSGTRICNGISENITTNFYARRIHDSPEPRLDVPKINHYLREKGVISSVQLGSGKISFCHGEDLVNEIMSRLIVQPKFFLLEEKN